MSIIGLPRSGTTFLEYQLASMIDCEYIGENNLFWEACFNYYKTNGLSAYQRKFIRKRIMCTDRVPVLEKSPCNVMHIQMLTDMFPDAKFVCLHRKFSAVVSSTEREWAKNASSAPDSQEERKKIWIYQWIRSLRKNMKLINPWFIILFPTVVPNFVWRAYNKILLKCTQGQRGYWGPLIPNYTQIKNTTSPAEKALMQQRTLLTQYDKNIRLIKKEKLYEISFEEVKHSKKISSY